MSQNIKAHAPPAKESGGFLSGLFRRGGKKPPGPEARSASRTKATLELGEIQGFILRGYRMPMVRHFLLTVDVPAKARELLGRLVSGDESDAPQITTAEDWHVGFEPGPGDNLADVPRRKPDYCLNLGITWPGLIALEIKDRVPTLSFKSFGAFTAGAAERAGLVGDTGPGAPHNWVGAFGTGRDHVLVTLHAISPEAMTAYSERLCALFAEGDAFRELWRCDGMALMEMRDGKPVPTTKVHFGYTDGISMTTIRGGPERYPSDHQQPCEPWLFVLGNEAENYLVPEPRELGLNGSFAVFKKIETDVVGFESFLQSNKDKIAPELLAAKMCGRWRNGVPLALSPETDSPPGGIPPDQLNNYEYVDADGSGDPKGLRCPVGAHMRRINPRGQPVTGQGEPGGSNNTHRLIRRGMPYGPAYDPTQPYDRIERGLLGYFINSSIVSLPKKVRRPGLLSLADIHLLPQRAEVADLVLPSKLAPMPASGRPVIAMARPGTQLAKEVEGAGLIVSPDKPAALVSALVRLADDPALREELGRVGRDRAQSRWDVQAILGRLERDLLSLARSRAQAG